MTAPTPAWADYWALIKHNIHWLEELRELCASDATNLITLKNSFLVAMEGPYAPDALAALTVNENALGDMLGVTNARARITPHMYDLMRIIGRPETELTAMNTVLKEYMHNNTLSVKSRGITYGTITAGGSNVGTGQLYRCTKDKYNYNLESIFFEAKAFECIQDESSTSRQAEQWIFRGTEREPTDLDVAGSGITGGLTTRNAQDAARYVSNPSFDLHNATDGAAPTSFTGWTFLTGSVANLLMRSGTTYVYRGSPNVATPWGMEATGNIEISQILEEVSNPVLLSTVPYHFAIAIKRKSSATGNVTITLGNKTATVAIGTLTNDVWYLLVLGPNVNNWYDSFKVTALPVKVKVDTLAVGTVVLDDLQLYPMDFLDGTFWTMAGGNTPWLKGDTYTLTDALTAADSVIQRWWFLAGLESLPHSGAPTITDP